MGLRSLPLLILLAVVTALLLAGMLRAWPSLGRRPGARTLLLRIGLLAALQASTLSLIFVWVNRSQEFYASWSDLLGTSTAVGHVLPDAGALPALASNPAPAAPLVTVRPVARRIARGAGGQLQQIRFRGAVSGLPAQGYVFLPPGYSRTGPRLPVTVVLSQEAASRTAPFGAQRIAAAAAARMSHGQLRRMILVVVSPRVAGPADTGCLDLPGGPQAATFFTQDLPQAVQASFQASRLPAQWAVVGGPGGGYCALQLATAPAGIFSVAAAPPGAYLAPPGRPAATTVWLRSEENLQWRLIHWPPPPVRLLFTGQPGTVGGLMPLVRPPMTAALVSLAPGRQPLTPVLTSVGRALGA